MCEERERGERVRERGEHCQLTAGKCCCCCHNWPTSLAERKWAAFQLLQVELTQKKKKKKTLERGKDFQLRLRLCKLAAVRSFSYKLLGGRERARKTLTQEKFFIFTILQMKLSALWMGGGKLKRWWGEGGGRVFEGLHFVVQLLKRGSCGPRSTHTANLCAAIKNKAAHCELNSATLFTQSSGT